MSPSNPKELQTLSTRRFESELTRALHVLETSFFVSRHTREILVYALRLACKLTHVPDVVALVDKLESTDYLTRRERSLVAMTVKQLLDAIPFTAQHRLFRTVVPDFIRHDIITVLKDSGASFLAIDDSSCNIRVSSVASKDIFQAELMKRTMPSDVSAEQLWQMIRYTQEDYGIPSPETFKERTCLSSGV